MKVRSWVGSSWQCFRFVMWGNGELIGVYRRCLGCCPVLGVEGCCKQPLWKNGVIASHLRMAVTCCGSGQDPQEISEASGCQPTSFPFVFLSVGPRSPSVYFRSLRIIVLCLSHFCLLSPCVVFWAYTFSFLSHHPSGFGKETEMSLSVNHCPSLQNANSLPPRFASRPSPLLIQGPNGPRV